MDEILKTITRLASGDYDARGKLSGVGDQIDAAISGLNMLAEEISHQNESLVSARSYVEKIISSMTDSLIVLNQEKVIERINQATLDLLQCAEDDLLGKSISTIFPDEQNDDWFADVINRGMISRVDKIYLSKTGAKIPVLFSSSVMRDSKGEVQAIICLAFDNTERIRANENLKLFSRVFENANEAIMITDRSGTIYSVNPAFTRITGFAESEIVGSSPSVLRSGRHSNEFYREMWNTIEKTGGWEGEIWNRKKTGEVYPEWLSISTIRGYGGSIEHYMAVFHDITTIKKTEEKAKYLAYHDPLTDLPNRLLFKDRLNQAMAHSDRNRSMFALFYLDLDDFKIVNDTLGHVHGDTYLQEISRVLTDSVRREDTVARIGGDEFAIIANELSSKKDAVRLVKEVLNRIKKPFLIDGRNVFGSVSIGVAFYPDDGDDPDSLIKQADACMYRAKKKGKSTYHLSGLSVDLDDRLKTEQKAS